jgi:hypothetical protein
MVRAITVLIGQPGIEKTVTRSEIRKAKSRKSTLFQ